MKTVVFNWLLGASCTAGCVASAVIGCAEGWRWWEVAFVSAGSLVPSLVVALVAWFFLHGKLKAERGVASGASAGRTGRHS